MILCDVSQICVLIFPVSVPIEIKNKSSPGANQSLTGAGDIRTDICDTRNTCETKKDERGVRCDKI